VPDVTEQSGGGTPRADRLKRIVLSGGGTAGHVMPALSVAQALLALEPGVELLYIGTAGGLEADLVPRAGIPFASIDVSPLSGRSGARALATGWRAALAVRSAARIIREFGPHAALGTGGYVAGPAIAAAWTTGVPAAIHEQNLRPGITNRWLARLAREIYVSFAASAAHFPGGGHKAVFTGYPVRQAIIDAERGPAAASLGLAPDRPTLLITSGSLGARRINDAVCTGLPMLAGRVPGLQVVVSTGADYFAGVRSALSSAGLLRPDAAPKVLVFPFIHQMEQAYAAADLVLCRAGGSIHEVLARGLPAILVPSPNVAYDQQTQNSRMLAAAGAAEVIDDAGLNGVTLAESVARLFTQTGKLSSMRSAAAGAGRPHAARDIAARLLSLS